MVDKVSHDEEMKIRNTWGDYIMLRGFPSFRDRMVDLPIEHEVTPFAADYVPELEAVMSSYTYKLTIGWRAIDFPVRRRVRETTIECKGVIVHREWTGDE